MANFPRPFFILATQNPIEQAGTYPLPEAQLDRFLLYIRIQYPTEQEELAILTGTTGVTPAGSKANLKQPRFGTLAAIGAGSDH